tara:strand:- start:718 stop:891 length:174 start_codon:yes stop_codon:yes gene_type:complete
MPDNKTRKDSKLSEKYIHLHQGKYRVRRLKHFDKSFDTLDEAIVFRDNINLKSDEEE